MRKIYTAITIMLFSASSFAGIGTSFISSSVLEQVTGTLETSIIEFSFPDQVGASFIQVTSTTVDVAYVEVTMPEGTDLTTLVADFTLSTGATAWVGGDQVTSTVTALDYSSDVEFIVKNGTESQKWLIKVSVEATPMVNVTFNVNMGTCAGENVVYLTGGFIGWTEPGQAGSIEMTNNGDGTYSTTVEIAAGTDDRYKYFVGAGWNGGDLTDGGCENGDRCLVLGTDDVTFDDVFTCNDVAVDESQLDAVSMYPNPVVAELTIANLEGVSKVVVSNLLGQTLVSNKVTTSVMKINTADFKSGIYVVTLVSETGVTRSQKIVK
jgi:hypothetical protein